MHPVLNLLLEFFFSFIRIAAAMRIAIRDIAISESRIAESKRGGRNGKEAILNGFEGAVDDGVDCVYDFVDEGLFARGLAGSGGC